MSADIRYVMEVIPEGHGLVLDLGGGRGSLRSPIEERGYRYLNLDHAGLGEKDISLAGDAHQLPFKDKSFDILISKDTLEHFVNPWRVMDEVRRVLKEGGLFIIWVPFMHPFHGDDLYRYTPLALRRMLKAFDILSFDSPLWVCTILGSTLIQILKKVHLKGLEVPVKRFCHSMDRLLTQNMKEPSGFAAAYRIVAVKKSHE
jgi:SAM-dependent methyltransferase